MRVFYAFSCALLLSLSAVSSFGQPAVTPAQKPSDILGPALAQVKQTVVGLNLSKWKAPGNVRSAMQQNVDSILRDINGTLPGLLTTADAAPTLVSAGFPVYRNIDALYDVLLRISLTANLAAPQDEDSAITTALSQLESARTNLGNLILTASNSNESELNTLRANAQKAAAAHTATSSAPKTTVVDDGPVKPTRRRKKSTPAATATPATSNPR